MITLSKSGNSVTFTFDENSGYLQNGTIDVPVNSLALITDESDMATFRKSASNDIFISARYEEFGMTKAELEAWYKVYMVGDVGGGVDSGTVQTMIDESISGKADTSAVTESIAEATSGKVDTSTFETYSGSVETALSGKVNTSTYTAYTSSTQTTLNSKLNKSAVENSLNNWTTNPVQNKVLFNELRISGLTMDEENVDVVTIGADDWYDEGGDYECTSQLCPTYLRKVVFTISNDEHAYDTYTSYVGVRDTQTPYGDFAHVDFSYHPNDPEVPQEAWIEINSVDIEGDMFSGVTASVSGTSITLEIPNIIYYDEWEQVYKEYEWGSDGIIWQMQMTDPETWEYLHVGTVTASASGAVATYTPVKDAVEDVEESLSGKVDTSAFTAYSSSTQATLNGKLNRSEVLNTVSSSSTAPVQSRILYNELNITETAETTVFDINFSGSSRGSGMSTNCPPKARTITYEISGNSQASIDLGFSEIGYTDINQEFKYVDSHLILDYYQAITDPDDPQYPRNAYLEYNSTEENGDGGSAISAYTISGTSVTVTLNTFTDYSNPDDPELVEWESHILSWNDRGDWSYGDRYGNVTAVAISEPTIVTTITPLKDKIALDEEVTAAALNGLNENKLDASAYTPTDLSNYYTKSETSGATQIQTALDSKVDNSTYSAYTASTDSRLAEDEEVTAAGLNAVNSALGGLNLQQITQSAYDSLTTKDPSTLFIIVN